MSLLSKDTDARSMKADDASSIRQLQYGYNSDSGFDSLGVVDEEGPDSHEEVLLNISPDKMKKPTDQLFIDFFSMYTKKFLEE